MVQDHERFAPHTGEPLTQRYHATLRDRFGKLNGYVCTDNYEKAVGACERWRTHENAKPSAYGPARIELTDTHTSA